MSDVSVAPDLAADHDGLPEARTTAHAERGTAVGRAYGSGTSLLARAVQVVLSGVLLIIVAGILLALLKANPGNSVVSEVHGWGRWLVGPFNGIFSFHRARVAVAVNWGIAAVIYLFAGGLVVRLIGRPHNWRPVGRSSISSQEES
jgi:hypothetical protein